MAPYRGGSSQNCHASGGKPVRHARANIDHLLDGEDRISFATARANRKMHLIRKLKQHDWTDKDGGAHHTTEIELHDAQAALVQLGRYHKLFVDRQEHTGALAVSVKGYVGISPDDWPDKPAG